MLREGFGVMAPKTIVEAIMRLTSRKRDVKGYVVFL